MIAAVNNELTHAHTHTTAAARITLCVCEEMNVLGWEALSRVRYALCAPICCMAPK
jgi:hypothetical protein